MLRTVYILLIALFSALFISADNRGIPFIHNYQATEYGAHNRSFDVACDDYGSVYFANFQGILYFDGSSWRTILTDKYIDAATGKVKQGTINRTTRIVWDKLRKRIWVGGYHFFGYLEPDDIGRQQLILLHYATDQGINFGEVDMICLNGKDVFVHATSGISEDGHVYKWDGKTQLEPYHSPTPFLQLNMEQVALGYTGGIHVAYHHGTGLTVSDATRQRTITETDGLCSDNVNFVMFDRQHTLWGATDHGIFAIEIPSPFSHITEGQGLNGDVYCINQLGETIYVGTLQGLFRIDNGRVSQVPGLDLACWQLTTDGNSLLASTTTGVYRIRQGMSPKRVETSASYATIPAPQGGYYTAEDDSIYYVPNEDDDNHYTRLANIGKATKLHIAGRCLIAETVNGQMYSISLEPPYHTTCLRDKINFSEPKIEYTDALGRFWKTSPKGDSLSISNHKDISTWIHPLTSKTLNAIYCGRENSLWVGGDFGVINCDLDFISHMKQATHAEPVYIRQVTLGDSVLWGGYTKNGYAPLSDVEIAEALSSDSHDLTIHFSSRYQSFVCPTRYRYREEGGQWNAWSEETSLLLHNLNYGDTEMEIEAMDLFGNISHATVSWHVNRPFYLQWWAIVFYLICLSFIGRAITRYRTKKLQRDKNHLEAVVNQRTSELKKTQKELVQAERTATAGKLTQGLIDRILNPLNYINNFSKLTSGLAKDLKADIEEEKDHMSEDSYEDCADILDMMNTNLTKIEEHGVNTTRTLRAMEAMLNQQTGTLRETSISALCDQISDITKENYKDIISQYGITFKADIADGITHAADAESLSNAIKALIANAFYAVEKRMKQSPYPSPEVSLTLESYPPSQDVPSSSVSEQSSTSATGSELIITVHDNGIGIEDTIKDKIFDPFFTTKPTSEAAGVGLYLVREIIQDHKGTITVNSDKDRFTDFKITL